MKQVTPTNIIRTMLLSIGLIGVAFAGAPSLPFYDTADFTPQWPGDISQETTEPHKVAAFSFTDQNGKTVTEQDFANKIYVAGFFFTSCPGICPKLTENMARVQTAFADDPNVVILFHSVMPDVDTPEVLKHYAKKHGVQSGKWYLVTGSREAIYHTARTSYFADAADTYKADGFLHTENFVLIDTERRIRGVYHGTRAMDINRLIEDIQTLKQEV